MQSLLYVISIALNLYMWVIILSAVMSWLIAFGVVDMRNQFVYTVADTLNRLTEPALRPIRNLLPNMGGIDISPVILILLIIFLQDFIRRYLMTAPGVY